MGEVSPEMLAVFELSNMVFRRCFCIHIVPRLVRLIYYERISRFFLTQPFQKINAKEKFPELNDTHFLINMQHVKIRELEE